MTHNVKSIRPFIGAKEFETSRNFYRDLGFEEKVLSSDMSFFHIGSVGFYLQQYYVREWIDNLMMFLEVDDVDRYFLHLQQLDLPSRYKDVKLKPVQTLGWGKECFLHDPSGVLWHFGQFNVENVAH